MKIKICGITNIEDALAAAGNGADALGFILYPGSKRYIEPEKVHTIVQQLPAFIMKIGVFVDETIENVNQYSNIAGFNAVQLHGNESYEFIKEVNLPVIKAISVPDNFDYSQLDNYPKCTFLLDAFHPELKGGTGLKFDWNSIPEGLKSKIILAGGIGADNVDYIYNNIKPQAIDVSSSVEISPGIKDHKKLNNLLRRVNRLRNNL